MTANEMARHVKILYDGASDIEMEYDDAEMSRLLSMSQYNLGQRHFFTNRNVHVEGYEIGSKRDSEFSELKTHVYIYNDTINRPGSVIVKQDGSVVDAQRWGIGIFPNSRIIELPADFMFYSVDMVDIDWKGVRITNVQIKSTNEDKMMELRINSFIKPDKRTIYRYTFPRSNDGMIDDINGNSTRTPRRCMLLTDEFTEIKRYYLSYIRQPNDIVVDIINPENQRHCELNEEIQLDIIRGAVQLALGSIASEKYQVALTENSLNE